MPPTEMYAELHELYKRYVVPPLKAEGFTRKGKFSMIKEAADDLWVYVRMTPYSAMPVRSFFVEWAVIPETLRGYKQELWSRTSIDPMATAIIEERFEAPIDLRTIVEDHDTWNWDPNGKFHPRLTMEEFGERLSEVVQDEGLPMWTRYQDRDVVAAHPWHRYSFCDGVLYPQAAQLILYIDHAPPETSQHQLDQLRSSEWPWRKLLGFLQQRLDDDVAHVRSAD